MAAVLTFTESNTEAEPVPSNPTVTLQKESK